MKLERYDETKKLKHTLSKLALYAEHTINCRSRYIWVSLDNKTITKDDCDCGLDELQNEIKELKI